MFERQIKNVYLAGPITGLSYADARNGWRKEISEKLEPHIKSWSPMRYKSFLEGHEKLDGNPDMYFDSLFASAKSITHRDRYDISHCDAMVANLLGTKEPSIGTCIEFGWADASRTPLIMIVEPYLEGKKTNPHQHAMLFEMASYIVHSIDDAVKVTNALLTDGV